MGNAEAKIVELIDNPEDEKKIRDLFSQFDKDGSGSLDENEWREFGRILWVADVKGAKDDVQKEV